MLSIIYGSSIFNSECKTLVCPVNCVGVMGKGLALSFKLVFPVFKWYKTLCNSEMLDVGNPVLYVQSDKPNILLFPTKYHWKDPSRLMWIIKGLENLFNPYPKGKVGFDVDSRKRPEYSFLKSVAFPALGCGCGGLSWEFVRPIMFNYLRPAKSNIEIYAPYGR